ncbi:FimB/Mfa2 family fimbrial subunit [uncultured Proteiniphilum sp.]|uniref:FimB/Mfa2 family fimbrial subunit n=1 Tax=uncultured Proteiniphilum sp. TaxID=497637 RepID=UPI002613CE05|nr:FimB/Mfa2 family fimbrial subunit [uncultured Proteiniphilum sp.]
MFQKSNPVLKIVLACFLSAGLAACSWLNDDLDDCSTGCQIQFRVAMDIEYNGLFNSQAFYTEVQDVNLWVFDGNGVYLGTYTEQGENLKKNDFTMDLPLEPGRYKMVVWTGLQDGFYEIPALTPGVSKVEDLTLRLKRDANSRQNEQLTPLWHGEIGDVEVKDTQYTLINVGLVKDTKTLIAVMQDVWGNDLNSEDYDFEIIAANGYMDYQNRLLDDDDIHYDAYYKQTAEVDTDNEFNTLGRAGGDDTKKFRVARAELNTLRLMTDKNTRFVVTEKATGRRLMNINLTQYLLLTRTLYEGKYGVKISDQAYLDYEDTYSVIFFLTPSGGGNSYICTSVSINGWIIRLNDAEL